MKESPDIPSLVGSWTFIRSSKLNANLSGVYHFTIDGLNYWETQDPGESRRQLFKLQYEFRRGILTLIYSPGSTHDFKLTAETDGSIRFPSRDGFDWWMTRLEAPLSDSVAFVDSSGRLERFN